MLQRLMNDVLATARSLHWGENFDLEVMLTSGRVITLPFVRADPGFLVLADDTKPEGFQETYFQAAVIESVRPVWR